MRLPIERADVLVRVDQFKILVELDVGGGDGAFLVRGQQQRLRFAGVRLEQHLLQVQHDIRHVLDHAVDGRELVHRAVDLDRGDGRAFQRGQQDTAQGVADRVTVPGFEGLRDELGIGAGGGGILFDQPLRHFKPT